MNSMKFFFCFITTTAFAKPSLYTFPTYYEPLATMPRSNLLQGVKSRFHTQNELGQYTYGYNDGLSSKIESKTADGITQGSYAYVDSNGIIQNVNYISDDINGFRVSASNLPMAHTYQYPVPEDPILTHENPTQMLAVTGNELGQSMEISPTESAKYNESKEKKSPSPDEAKVTAEKQNTTATFPELTTIFTKAAATAVAPAAQSVANVANVIPTYATYQPFSQFSWYPQQFAPVQIASYRYPDVAPLSPVYSQFHAQDEYGQYSYGYSGGPSSKMEMKTLDGITRGGYSYIDANGILQKVNYVSDPINGFRVAATNLPISNIATAYYPTEFQLPELNLITHSDKSKTD